MRLKVFIGTLFLVLALGLAGCSRGNQNAEQQTPDNAAQADNQSGQGDAQGTATPSLRERPASERSAEKPRKVVVSEGTQVSVRMGQSVGSKLSSAGDKFSGTIATAVKSGGAVAIPAGAEVSGHVAEAVPLGRFKGAASLELVLDSVTVKGKAHSLKAVYSATAKGKGKRTAVMAGGGAGLGALIGGLTGGGKGAAIGAAAGAGAGTAGAAFTGNKNIELPAESTVAFRVQHSAEF